MHLAHCTDKYSTPACGGTITDTHGQVESLAYPQQYPDGSDCTWTMSSVNNHPVNFTFPTFDVPDNSTGFSRSYFVVELCNGDGCEEV